MYEANKQGVNPLAFGAYAFYSQFIYYEGSPPTFDEVKRCTDGPHTLPRIDGRGDRYICFSADKANGPFNGVMSIKVAGHELEYRAPFAGFLDFPSGTPLVQLGQTIRVSISIETSGEFSVPAGAWVSDTVDPIVYTLEPLWRTTPAGIAVTVLIFATGAGLLVLATVLVVRRVRRGKADDETKPILSVNNDAGDRS